MSSVTSLTAVKSPNFLVTCSMRMYAGAPGFFQGACRSGARGAVRELSFTVVNLLQSVRIIAPERGLRRSTCGRERACRQCPVVNFCQHSRSFLPRFERLRALVEA